MASDKQNVRGACPKDKLMEFNFFARPAKLIHVKELFTGLCSLSCILPVSSNSLLTSSQQ